jgi:hypothetical protein
LIRELKAELDALKKGGAVPGQVGAGGGGGGGEVDEEMKA